MAIDQTAQDVAELVRFGERVAGTKHQGPLFDLVRQDTFYEWRATCLSFLSRVFGEDSVHFREFKEGCDKPSWIATVNGNGVMKAAKRDIESGHLTKLYDLVAADVFTDFLDMADHLLEKGYKDAAASLIGAVLEDGLKRISSNHGISVKSRDDIGAMNARLATKQVYPRLVQQQLQVWNSIRNSADHGDFNEYDLTRVKQMCTDVRSFLAKYLV